MISIAEEKTCVAFNAPTSLVERVDSVVEILNISRTRLLIDALEDELEALAADEEFRRRLSDAYYDGRVGYVTVEAIFGREEAMPCERSVGIGSSVKIVLMFAISNVEPLCEPL